MKIIYVAPRRYRFIVQVQKDDESPWKDQEGFNSAEAAIERADALTQTGTPTSRYRVVDLDSNED